MLYETFKSEVLSQLNADVGITVAFSGGSDSVALLHLFWRLKRERGYMVNAVHVEHGIRGQLSLRDAEFAESFCQKIGIPLQIVHIDVPSYQKINPSISIEEAARLLRYKALKENATKFNSQVIALGHHADDQIETILLNILRGTGISGLTGIQKVREEDGFLYFRPLLDFTKDDILVYCQKNHLNYVDDETNFETDYTRNRLRLQLLPLLETYNPAFKKTILRLKEAAEETEAYLDSQLAREEINVYSSLGPNKTFLKINLDEISKLPTILVKRLLRQLVKEITGFYPDYNTVLSLESLTNERLGSSYHQLSADLVASREYNTLYLAQSFALLPEPEIIFKKDSSGTLTKKDWYLEYQTLPKEKIDLGMSTPLSEVVDEEKLIKPLKLRTRKPGDIFFPLGALGPKKLKDFFIDLKVPKRLRKQIPLLVDTEDNIVWVVGFRISEAYKVDENTKHCLVLRIVRSCQAGSPVL